MSGDDDYFGDEDAETAIRGSIQPCVDVIRGMVQPFMDRYSHSWTLASLAGILVFLGGDIGTPTVETGES